MTIKTNIQDIDNQGEGKKVLTDYQPHTISIVGKGALGINLTKVKSKDAFLETKGGAKLMAKVNKAKALDEKPDNQVETPVEVPVEPEQDKGADVPNDPEVPAEVVTEVPEVPAEPEQDKGEDPEVVEPETPAEPEPEPEPDVQPEQHNADTPNEDVAEPEGDSLEIEQAGEKSDKAKAFTVDELIQAQKDALDGLNLVFKKIQSALPDAKSWEVSDLIYNALYRVEGAVWEAKESLWDDIYDEVYTEVSTRVNKAKALKVEESGTKEDKLKSALSLLSPEMSEIVMAEINTNKAKALEAEESRKSVIRAKALEKGAESFKRIATDENTTDMITDAMLNLEIKAPEDHKVIAKALETASLLTMAGNLFPDVGSSASLQVQTEQEYVAEKAKSLVEKEGGNLAAARATVRQSEEFQTLYG